jgi:hypothetical protein
LPKWPEIFMYLYLLNNKAEVLNAFNTYKE